MQGRNWAHWHDVFNLSKIHVLKSYLPIKTSTPYFKRQKTKFLWSQAGVHFIYPVHIPEFASWYLIQHNNAKALNPNIIEHKRLQFYDKYPVCICHYITQSSNSHILLHQPPNIMVLQTENIEMSQCSPVQKSFSKFYMVQASHFEN